AHDVAVIIADTACVVTAELLVLIITWSKTYSIKIRARGTDMGAPLSSMLIGDGR
ncbi:hypothetical protein OBBRIDRAFT_741143, partial [Obba rivulosa]